MAHVQQSSSVCATGSAFVSMVWEDLERSNSMRKRIPEFRYTELLRILLSDASCGELQIPMCEPSLEGKLVGRMSACEWAFKWAVVVALRFRLLYTGVKEVPGVGGVANFKRIGDGEPKDEPGHESLSRSTTLHSKSRSTESSVGFTRVKGLGFSALNGPADARESKAKASKAPETKARASKARAPVAPETKARASKARAPVAPETTAKASGATGAVGVAAPDSRQRFSTFFDISVVVKREDRVIFSDIIAQRRFYILKKWLERRAPPFGDFVPHWAAKGANPLFAFSGLAEIRKYEIFSSIAREVSGTIGVPVNKEGGTSNYLVAHLANTATGNVDNAKYAHGYIPFHTHPLFTTMMSSDGTCSSPSGGDMSLTLKYYVDNGSVCNVVLAPEGIYGIWVNRAQKLALCALGISDESYNLDGYETYERLYTALDVGDEESGFFRLGDMFSSYIQSVMKEFVCSSRRTCLESKQNSYPWCAFHATKDQVFFAEVTSKLISKYFTVHNILTFYTNTMQEVIKKRKGTKAEIAKRVETEQEQHRLCVTEYNRIAGRIEIHDAINQSLLEMVFQPWSEIEATNGFNKMPLSVFSEWVPPRDAFLTASLHIDSEGGYSVDRDILAFAEEGYFDQPAHSVVDPRRWERTRQRLPSLVLFNADSFTKIGAKEDAKDTPNLTLLAGAASEADKIKNKQWADRRYVTKFMNNKTEGFPCVGDFTLEQINKVEVTKEFLAVFGGAGEEALSLLKSKL